MSDLAELYADRLAMLKRRLAPLIAIGRHCQTCAMLIGFDARNGKPQTCFICRDIAAAEKAKVREAARIAKLRVSLADATTACPVCGCKSKTAEGKRGHFRSQHAWMLEADSDDLPIPRRRRRHRRAA